MMFRELKALEYTVEILKVLRDQTENVDARTINDILVSSHKIEPAYTYLQKVLQKMSKVGLVKAQNDGYKLIKPLDEIMVSDILDICDMPEETSPIFTLCKQLKEAVSLTPIEEFAP